LVIPHSVSKTELLKQVEALYQKIDAKHAARHHSYIVAVSLMVAAESSISAAH
jgi:hypothetical protein